MSSFSLFTLPPKTPAIIKDIKIDGLLRYRLQLLGILVGNAVEVFCRRKRVTVLLLEGKNKVAIENALSELLVVEQVLRI